MKKLNLQFVGKNFDTLTRFVIALVVFVLSVLGKIDQKTMLTWLFSLFVINAISMFKNYTKFEEILGKLNKVIDSSKEKVADGFFTTGSDEREIMIGAERNLSFIQETGSRITENNRSDLITFLSKGGNVKIVITLPEEETVQLMAFRNETPTMDIGSMIRRYDHFVTQIKGILRTLETNQDGVEVRYFPYPIGITAVIADPEHRVKKKRKAIVRYADFLTPYEEKLDFEIDGNESEKTFHYYYQQFLNMSRFSYKCMFLTGAPKAGKSTLFSQIAETYSNEKLVYSIISKEIIENGKRVGFEVKTSSMSTPKTFAQVKDHVVQPGEDKYCFQEQIWTDIAQELLANQDKIIVLDEIGPMQLRCEAFRNAIQQLVNQKTTTIFATIALQSDQAGIISSLKNHYRTGVYELTPNTREKMLQVFRDELMSSVNMYQKRHTKGD